MKQLYEKICKEIDHWEPWKKKYYNDTFAISSHSKNKNRPLIGSVFAKQKILGRCILQTENNLICIKSF